MSKEAKAELRINDYLRRSSRRAIVLGMSTSKYAALPCAPSRGGRYHTRHFQLPGPLAPTHRKDAHDWQPGYALTA